MKHCIKQLEREATVYSKEERRSSSAGKTFIAKELGYDSWKELRKASFQGYVEAKQH